MESLSVARAEMFMDFVRLMEESGIAYVILGRCETYPAEISSDIDFLIHSSSRSRLETLLRTPGIFGGSKMVQEIRHENTASFYAIARCFGSDLACINPDLTTDYRRRGKLFMTAEELLMDRERSPNGLFWVPSIGKRFEYYYKKRLDKGVLGKSHFEYLAGLFNQHPNECSEVIARLQPKFFGSVCSAFRSGIL